MNAHQPQSIKRIARMLRAVLFIAGATYAQQPQQQPHVVLNEILFQPDVNNTDPNRNHEWVELYNGSGGDVSLAGWTITTRDGLNVPSARPLPAVTLPAGDYLVIHFSAGASNLDFSSGSANFYTGDDPSSPYWNPVQDEAALFSPQGIVDFLSWTRSDTPYKPGAAYNAAFTGGIWPQNGVVVWDGIQPDPTTPAGFLQPGSSLGRNADSRDTNSPADFSAHGGVNAADVSPGRQNLDYAYFVSAPNIASGNASPQLSRSPRAQLETHPSAAPAAWTVLIYSTADESIESYRYDTLKQIRSAIILNNNANVNFVVQFRGQKVARFATLDENNNVATVTPAGTTVRGRISADTVIAGNPYAKKHFLALETPAGQSSVLGPVDMGDPQTLKDFITWGKSNYPAGKYALVIAGHGDGWKQIGLDPSSPGWRQEYDALYMGELTTALQGQSFDLIALDACMMAAVEVAWQLTPVPS